MSPLRSSNARYAPRIHYEGRRYAHLSCPLRSSSLFFEDAFLVYAVETAVDIDTVAWQLS